MLIMCLRSAATKVLVELIKYGCKSKCEKRQRSCVQINLNCAPASPCSKDFHNQDGNTEKLVDGGVCNESNLGNSDDAERFLTV